MAAAERRGQSPEAPPATTAMGALLNHITGGHISTIDAGARSFQPMNINFGLFPPVDQPVKSADGRRLRGPEKAAAKKRALTARAKADLRAWRDGAHRAAAQ
jgi:methylenetetrahydrofolate--tRNA-(uracil-5-)-methyltransferase